MNMQKRNTTGLMLAAVVILLFFRKAASLSWNQTGSFHGLNYNLAVYASAVLAAFLVYLIMGGVEKLFFYQTHSFHPGKASAILSGILSFAVAAACLFYIYKVYADEVNNFPESFVRDTLRQSVSHPLYFAAVCAGAYLLFLIARRASRIHSILCRWIVLILFSLFSAFLLWCPSPYYDMGGTMLHVHAYTNSIANVSAFIPFSRLNLSIYGHYALLYLPFIKLFGKISLFSGYPAVALTISMFGFLTFFFAGYTVHKTIKNDILFYITIIALAGTTTILNRRGQYYQINPHRLFMPAFSLAYVAWKEFHVKRDAALKMRILELMIGILAITWNLETGIFAICTIGFARIFRQLSGHRFFSGEVWGEIFFLIVLLPLSFFGSWGLIGLYNIAVGGTAESIRTFVYPLFSGNYNVNNLRLPLRGWTALYVPEIILFALTAFHCIKIAWTQKGSVSSLIKISFAVSVSGLMNLVYFMNRTAYGNIQITHIQLILLIGILSASAVGRKRPETGLLTFLVSGVIFIGLCFLMIESCVSAPEAVLNRKNSHSQEFSAAETWYSQIRENVPENTFAFGVGIPEAYMSLGWDTGCHMIDFADPNEYNTAYLEDLIANEDAVLTTDAAFAEQHPEFEAKGAWTAYYCTATYYIRVKSA